MPERALLYVRISELTDASTSPERQRADCEAYATRMGWQVAGTFEDLDISGTKAIAQRHQLRAALELIEGGGAEYLVAAKIDRVARSVITFSEIVKRLQDSGASLVSVGEGLDFSTAAGRMVANVLATFAQFESEQIGLRVKSAKAHLTAEGKWPGGRRPYGWTPVPHESGKGFVLALDPDEAAVLSEAAKRIIEGESPAAVAGDLNRRGVVTVLGHPWVAHTLRQALTKPAMIGRFGATRLLSDEDYARLQTRLRRAEPTTRRYEHPELLLPPSVVKCGLCGSAMRAGTTAQGRRVYRCSQRPAPGVGGCFLIAAAAQVDALVEERLIDAVGAQPITIPAEPVTVDPAAEERAAIIDRMGQLEQDRYVRGLFPGDDGSARFERVYGSLLALLGDLPPPYTIDADADHSMPTGERFAEAWADADIETRRTWVESILVSVSIAPGRGGRRFDPERLTFEWVS